MASVIDVNRILDRGDDRAVTKMVTKPIVDAEVSARKAEQIRELIGGSYAELLAAGTVKGIDEYKKLWDAVKDMV